MKYVTYLYDYPINDPPISLSTWPMAIAPAAYFSTGPPHPSTPSSAVVGHRHRPSTPTRAASSISSEQPFNYSETKIYDNNNELEYIIRIIYTMTYALNRQYYQLTSRVSSFVVVVVVRRPIRRRQSFHVGYQHAAIQRYSPCLWIPPPPTPWSWTVVMDGRHG